jgi:hypothetical protein
MENATTLHAYLLSAPLLNQTGSSIDAQRKHRNQVKANEYYDAPAAPPFPLLQNPDSFQAASILPAFREI